MQFSPTGEILLKAVLTPETETERIVSCLISTDRVSWSESNCWCVLLKLQLCRCTNLHRQFLL
jgi:hypothetical protein